MRKISGKGILEQYDQTSGRFTGIIESKARVAMAGMQEFVGDKMWLFTFGKFYDRRSTGKFSQSNHIWGHCQQIAKSTGTDIDTVHMMAKIKAVSWGYPFDVAEMMVKGEMQSITVPWSETRINTKQAGILIEVIHWMASEMSIVLYEGEDE